MKVELYGSGYIDGDVSEFSCIVDEEFGISSCDCCNGVWIIHNVLGLLIHAFEVAGYDVVNKIKYTPWPILYGKGIAEAASAMIEEKELNEALEGVEGIE